MARDQIGRPPEDRHPQIVSNMPIIERFGLNRVFAHDGLLTDLSTTI